MCCSFLARWSASMSWQNDHVNFASNITPYARRSHSTRLALVRFSFLQCTVLGTMNVLLGGTSTPRVNAAFACPTFLLHLELLNPTFTSILIKGSTRIQTGGVSKKKNLCQPLKEVVHRNTCSLQCSAFIVLIGRRTIPMFLLDKLILPVQYK